MACECPEKDAYRCFVERSVRICSWLDTPRDRYKLGEQPCLCPCHATLTPEEPHE